MPSPVKTFLDELTGEEVTAVVAGMVDYASGPSLLSIARRRNVDAFPCPGAPSLCDRSA